MMHRLLLIFALGILLSSCTASSGPSTAGNYPAPVSGVIQANCLGGNCHNTATPLNTQLDLSTWEAMTKGSVYFNEVIPFNAVKSHLFEHVNTNSGLAAVITPTMPYARNPLSSSDQLIFFNWITQGAKSESGKIPYSESTEKFFVVNQNESMVSVIDAPTQRLIRIISLESNITPKAIAMMPDLKSFIVAMSGSNGMTRKFSSSDYQNIGEFSSGLNPYEIAITPDGLKGYITSDEGFTGNKFGVFDPIAMKSTKTLSSSLIIEPHGVTIAPDGKYAYICGRGSDNILRIDTKTDSIVGSLLLGPDVESPVTSSYNRKYLPEKIIISSDSKRMYVSCVNTSEVVEFDLTNDSIIGRIKAPIFPVGAALTPDGSELWTLANGSNQVHVISTASNTETFLIDSVSLNPQAISFTPDGAYAFVACEFSAGGVHHHVTGGQPASSYAVIDTRSKKIVSIQDLPAYSVSISRGYK